MAKIDAPWLTHPGTQQIFGLVDAPIYAVGGCVRNTLLSEPVADIDFATAAHPPAVVAAAEAAGLRVIPTGIDHGTVTVIARDQPFEITTFRRDVATDGRRATVAFSETLEEDARRRDFTVNAIYADASGHLLDPTGGLADINNRRFRFIEDAARRIQEDYLRSLRFFRFTAWYGDPKRGFDTDTLDAIARNLDGLETLSRERVGSEMLRLLSAPDPAPAVAAMRMTGVLARVLPGAEDTALAPLVMLEQGLSVAPDPIRRLAVIGGDTETLRLSRAQTTALQVMRGAGALSPSALGYSHGVKTGRDALLVSAAILGQPVAAEALEQLSEGAEAVFPITPVDLMDRYQGKALGEALKRLETRWIDSSFTLSRQTLLSEG